jgi:hypothetical protein
MIYFRKEIEPVRNGFNFYPPKDEANVGFVFKLRSTYVWVRYSKITSKFYFIVQKGKR